MTGIQTAEVRRALAEWIAAEIEGAVWSETEPYAPTDRAVTLRDLPSEPDTAVAIELYDWDEGLTLPNVAIRAQLLFRGRGDDADDFADEVFARLHGLHHATLPGGIILQRAVRLWAAPMSPDDNRRERRSDNYSLTFMRP